jgi:phage shock protein C
MDESRPGTEVPWAVVDDSGRQGHAPPHAPSPRVLRRSKDDRVAFGVAGGIGRYFDIDPVIVRVAFVLLTIFGGSGLLLYVIGVVAIPEERPADQVGPAGTRRGGSNQDVAVVIGAGLVVLGSLSLAGQILPAVSDFVGPVLLLTAGVLVIMLGGRR